MQFLECSKNTKIQRVKTSMTFPYTLEKNSAKNKLCGYPAGDAFTSHSFFKALLVKKITLACMNI